MNNVSPSLYSWIMLIGIIVGAFLWQRRLKSSDPALFGIFVGGIVGAFFGAKVVYFLAEGWTHIGSKDFWLQLAHGKTIIGALLGGYGGVELTKKLVNYRKPTGDWFAFMVPLGIAFGRIGCLTEGCCLGKNCPPDSWYSLQDKAGVDRWPAAPVELFFNLFAITVLITLRKAPSLRGQLFHIYLIAYGLFRFLHEFMRETPRVVFDLLTGYQIAAAALFALALWRYIDRSRTRVDAME